MEYLLWLFDREEEQQINSTVKSDFSNFKIEKFFSSLDLIWD